VKKALIISFLVLSACSGSGGGGGGTDSVQAAGVSDPIYGTWYYQAPGATSTQAKGIIGKIDANGIQILNAYIYTDGSNATVYIRKSIGTYTRSGDVFSVKYSYETCSPVGQETMFLSVVGDKLTVLNQDKSVQLLLSRAVDNGSLLTAAFIEDKNCNILSKIEAKAGRSPASVKANSFLDRVIK
jgi:hypothetical protein